MDLNPLTQADVADILALLDSLPYDELDLETPRFRLTLRRTPGGWTQSSEVRGAPTALTPASPEPDEVSGAGEGGPGGGSAPAEGVVGPAETASMSHRGRNSDINVTSVSFDHAPGEAGGGVEARAQDREAGIGAGGVKGAIGVGGGKRVIGVGGDEEVIGAGGVKGVIGVGGGEEVIRVGRAGIEGEIGAGGEAGSEKGFGAGGELVAVQAPLPGTFYRAPRPGAAPFVEVGSRVGADTVVGIVETMKLMNSVPAGVVGTVAEFCVANAEFAAHGATLLRVRADQ